MSTPLGEELLSTFTALPSKGPLDSSVQVLRCKKMATAVEHC